jgi:hypothetical protein
VSFALPPGVELVVLTVRVDAPVALSGEKLAVAFAGRPLALSVTVPLKPFTGVTCTAYVVLAPAVTDCDAGPVEIEKSGLVAEMTVNEADALSVVNPLIAESMRRVVLTGVELAVVIVSVELPDPPCSELGLNVPVAPDGMPSAVRLTVPL